MSLQENEIEIKSPEAKKIGGWLILVAIGLLTSPLRLLYLIISIYPPIFTQGSWEILTSPESEEYSVLWAPLLIGEVTINITLLIVSLYMIYLFFDKKSSFPKWYASTAALATFFVIADAYMLTLILPGLEMFDIETMKELGRSLVSLLIWTPYLFLSQRAKETFIN